MQRIIIAALGLLFAHAASAAVVTPPALSQAAANPSGFRDALGNNPAYYTPGEFGAAGDAIRSYSSVYDLPTGASPTLRLLGTYQIDGATINCAGTGNNNNTFTLPAGSLPVILGGTTTYRIQIANCPGLTNAALNAISGSGVGPYTITTDVSSSSPFSGSGTVVIDPTGFKGSPDTTTGATTPQWWHLGTGSISGTTLTMPANTFNTVRDVTQSNASGLMSTYVAIDDPAGVCPQYRGVIVSAASTTTATLSPAPTCTGYGANLAVWSADLMFPTTVASGPTFTGRPWSCEFVRSGAASIPLVLPVASYVDPFHVTMTGAASVAQAGFTSILTCGTPDDTAVDAAATAAFLAGRGSLYSPLGKNYLLASSATSVNIAKVSLCNDGYYSGHIYWPSDHPNMLNFGRCTPTRGQPQMRRTITPRIHLAHSLTVAGRAVRVAMLSDSLFQAESNLFGDIGSGGAIINDWLSGVLGKAVAFYNYSIGGTTLANLAPNSILNISGNGVGIPTTPQIATVSSWYTNSSQKWIDYAKAACADVVLLEFTNDVYNLPISAFYDVNGYLNTAWQASCGFTPDILYIPTGGNGASNYSQLSMDGFNYQQDFFRSAILAGDTMPPGVVMGNGGAVGLLDFGASYLAKRYGYDYYSPPFIRAVSITPGGTANTTQLKFPFTWPRAIRNYQYSTGTFETTTSNITSSTFWNTTLGGAFNIPLGSNLGTPNLVNGQSSPLVGGYPNNELQISRDAGGNVAVTGYTYRLAETPASCSMTSGAAVLTCTTAIANVGHYYSNIIIQGAGAAACPVDIGGSNCLNTTIAAGGVSTNGKVITTVANASATITNAATNLVIYRTFLPYTISPVSAQINNGSDGSPVCAICGLATGLATRVKGPFAEIQLNFAFANGNPVFNGPVTRFGGTWTPVLTMGISNATTPTNQWFLATLGQNAEDANDWVQWTPTLAVDADCWGQSPGYVGPEGGGYSGHMTVECMNHMLGDVLAANDVSAYDPSFAGVTVVAAAAGSTTIPNGVGYLNLTPAGTIATFTVNMPAVPNPNLPVTVSTTQTITALTMAGGTFNGAPTTLTANTSASFRFDQAAQKWNRIQ